MQTQQLMLEVFKVNTIKIAVCATRVPNIYILAKLAKYKITSKVGQLILNIDKHWIEQIHVRDAGFSYEPQAHEKAIPEMYRPVNIPLIDVVVHYLYALANHQQLAMPTKNSKSKTEAFNLASFKWVLSKYIITNHKI